MHFNKADISENELLETFGEEVFRRLLRDHTTQGNIFWATTDYAERGEGFGEKDQITIEQITGENERVIVPRAVKSKEQQKQRTQDKAEVFTPSWICNAMNSLVHDTRLKRKHVFNIPSEDERTWTATTEPVTFPEGMTWVDFISDNEMEITCGEAPFLVSRYDTTTAELLPIKQRIGILDRKLRVVGENCHDRGTWIPAARRALQSVYGYEWQGDNLLLARENIFVTMIEYFQDKFSTDELPDADELLLWADVISWNIFQMDGLKLVVPMSCHDIIERDIFGNEQRIPCPACKRGLKTGFMNHIKKHNGVYCKIRDWAKLGEEGYIEELYYKDLLETKDK